MNKGDDIMKTKISFFFIIVACISLFSINAQGNASNELTAFVNNAIKELNAASVKIPQFDKATIDTIQNLGKINNNTLYLCWLKNEKERTGYIAVASNGKSFQVVAFSATTAAPDYFLKKLQIGTLSGKPLNLSKAKQMSFVDNVPLVATVKTVVANESVETSEIASSLSSLFNHLQHKDKILLLHFDTGFNSDPEYDRRFKENPAIARRPDDPKWKSFDDEAREATNREKERENIQNLRPNELTTEQRANFESKSHEIIKPIIRRRLLNPVNAVERMDVIIKEQNTIQNITRRDISSGMRDAILLQQDYLNENGTDLKQNINIFFKTRGRTAQIETLPFDKKEKDSLPAVLIGPDNIVAVLLGFLDIDGERFATIFFPKTGKPRTLSLTQKLIENRIANNLPTEPNKEKNEEYQKALKLMKEAEEKQRQIYKEKGLPDPIPEKSAEERIREGVQRVKDLNDKMIVVEDINGKYPECLESGVHLINSQQLLSWSVLNISKIEIGNNW